MELGLSKTNPGIRLIHRLALIPIISTSSNKDSWLLIRWLVAQERGEGRQSKSMIAPRMADHFNPLEIKEWALARTPWSLNRIAWVILLWPMLMASLQIVTCLQTRPFRRQRCRFITNTEVRRHQRAWTHTHALIWCLLSWMSTSLVRTKSTQMK